MKKIKEILKPTVRKIILTIILFVVAYIFQVLAWTTVDYWAAGFPLKFQESWGPCPPGGVCHSFNWLFLIIDIIFWYLIAGALCLLRGKKTQSKTSLDNYEKT